MITLLLSFALHAEGYTHVRAAKTHFQDEARACAKPPCAFVRKAYLVKGDFVQTGEEEGGFVRATFPGRKPVTGWLATADLLPIRSAPLTRADLNGTWLQSPCNAGDDCVLEIGPDGITLEDYLHDRPGGKFDVKSVRETSEAIEITGTPSGMPERTLRIRFRGDGVPAGTVRLEGDESYAGVYRKRIQ